MCVHVLNGVSAYAHTSPAVLLFLKTPSSLVSARCAPVVFTFPTAVTIPDKINIKEEKFILTHSLSQQFSTWGSNDLFAVVN